MKIDFIIPVRDRDIKRIKNCISSLKDKIIDRIILVDYGSKIPIDIKGVEIIRIDREKFPIWNKSHALNIGIRKSSSDWIGVIDCDIILSPDFFKKIKEHLKENSFIYSNRVKRIEKFTNYKESIKESFDWHENKDYQSAVGGIQIFPREWIIKNRGYDETLNYWGGMDTYLFKLAEISNLKISNINSILLHQEHENKKEEQLEDEKERIVAKKLRLERTRYLKELFKDFKINNSENWGMPDKKTLISIVVSLREDDSLQATINSLANQTFKDFVVILSRDEGKGSNYARNKGFKQVNTEFVLFSDNDIDWRKNAIEVLYKTLKDNPDKSYSYGTYLIEGKKYCWEEFNLPLLKTRNYISTMSLIRSKDFTGFDEKIVRLQDWDLWLAMSEQGKTGIHCGEVIFNTIKGNGITHNSISYEKALEVIKNKHHI